MRIEMVMPQMGESIVEGTIVRWTKKVGDPVAKDENVLEISTDKVDSEIPSPSAGRIVELKAKEGETVPVGQVIAILETDAGPIVPTATPPARSTAPLTPVAAPPVVALSTPPAAASIPAPPAAPGPPLPILTAAPAAAAPASRASEDGIPRETGGRFYSPLVRSMARQEGISAEDLAAIPGHGRDGRLTRDDLLLYLEARRVGSAQRGGATAPGAFAAAGVAQVPAGGGYPGAPAGSPSQGLPELKPYPRYVVSETRTTSEGPIEVVQMDVMRQKIAEHMVRSKATSPHVASVTEVDMTQVVRFREARKVEFEARYGLKLTYTPFIVAAAVRALVDYPMMNASIEGTQLLLKRFVNVGVAVALENGLIVPVVKHAEEKSFLGLARAIQDLASRARAKKLLPDDVQGGTFAVTNMGGFGNLFGIPIINQPNVGILGAGAIVKRPVVVGDAIAIRDILYLSLSYDHRVVDGALGGLFIQRVRHYLEFADLAGGI